ncbi:hypothetical protein HAP94_25530, partial [Acidithiobacillus ferrivorans]|nr:hypothetical protein [Acidithiobacillus ferrivorans]
EPFIFENVIPDTQPEWLIVNYERLGTLLEQLDAKSMQNEVNALLDDDYVDPLQGATPLQSATLSQGANHDWEFVVAAFDEAHYLKEPSAQRTQASFD